MICKSEKKIKIEKFTFSSPFFSRLIVRRSVSQSVDRCCCRRRPNFLQETKKIIFTNKSTITTKTYNPYRHRKKFFFPVKSYPRTLDTCEIDKSKTTEKKFTE